MVKPINCATRRKKPPPPLEPKPIIPMSMMTGSLTLDDRLIYIPLGLMLRDRLRLKVG
jgi:hypothetical protein